MSDYEKRVEALQVISHFPTGEVKETKSMGLIWVEEDAKPPEGVIYCSISSDVPEASEWNIRRKPRTMSGANQEK